MSIALPRILALLATLVFVINGAHSQVDLARDGASGDDGEPSLVSADTAASSPDDIYWDDRFTLDSLNVSAVAAHGDELYVCGDFRSIDGKPASHIAVWNKRTKEWSTLGSGLNGAAVALAVQGDDLYVGGSFSTAGGDSTGPIARWSIAERRWFRLPALPQRTTVSAIAVDATELYAATIASQSPAPGSHRILARMKLGGDAWDALPGDVHGYLITHLGLMGGYLYAVGPFGDIADVPGTRWIARWNRSTGIWSALGGPAPVSGGAGRIMALAVGNGNVYIGGSFDSVESAQSRCLAVWDTSSGEWSQGGIGLEGRVTSLASSHDTLYIGGVFKLLGQGVQEGSRLLGLDAHDGGLIRFRVEGVTIDHIALTGSDLYIVGDIWRAGGTPIDKIGHYDMTPAAERWESPIFGHGFGIADGPVDRMVAVGERFWVMGGYPWRVRWAGDVRTTGIAAFDGWQWKGTGEPVDWTMTAIATYDPFIGPLLHVAHLPSPTAPTSLSGWNYDVSEFFDVPIWGTITTMVQYGAELWCAGDLRLVESDPAGVSVASWDGVKWTVRLRNVVVDAMVATATDLYVGGVMPDPQGGPGGGLARWDGVRWVSVGGGVGGNFITDPAHVTSLAVHGSDLYVAGEFVQAGSRNIARWDGSLWHGLGRGITGSGRINALAVNGSVLYAGGSFDSFTNGGSGDGIGRVATRNIARWDKTTGRWSALGTGLDDTVTSLAMLGNILYAGGWFTMAGGKPSEHIAAWRDPSSPASAPGSNGTTASAFALQSIPNPARTTTTIAFNLSAPATVRLSIINSVGIEIATLADERMTAGEHAVAWETADVPGGVYYCRLRCGDRMETRSVVVIR